MNLKNYLNENGLKIDWFAKQLGISRSFFYLILNGQKPVPMHLWRKINELTKGYITLEELLHDSLDRAEKLRKQ